MRTLIPQMAAAILPRHLHAAQAGDPFDRDARLFARSRTRRPVQRGLFDRRAERDAEETDAEDQRAGGSDAADVTTGETPQPVLLLFMTS